MMFAFHLRQGCGHAARWGLAGWLLVLGCASTPSTPELPISSPVSASPPSASANSEYRLRSPDVIELTCAPQPGRNARYLIDAEGRIDLGDAGRPRVEGETMAECAEQIADWLHLPSRTVEVHVAEYESRRIYLFGKVWGKQRSIPYRGPERLSDVLARAGGMGAGAAAERVYLLRAGVAEGRSPELYHVAGSTTATAARNIIVQPYDEIYIDETKPSPFARCFLPWFKPICERCSKLAQSWTGNKQ
jgi:protein involved in polysaccharide export with SLBB domain